MVISSGDAILVEGNAKIYRKKDPGEEIANVANKGEYFEWICGRCKWGARGYDKDAIMIISKRHDKLGCRQFASEIESNGLRIDN